ncbi:MAG: hypothetical protein GF384_04475, partial [Elusimicrobia bacterium]|nr:hypothetical protein [Elusimicrobiota bacterium]
EQYAFMDHYRETITGLGIIIEPFGTNSFMLRELPNVFGAIADAQEFLALLAEQLDQEVSGSKKPLPVNRDTIIRAACRAAVKSRDQLAHPQSTELINKLRTCKEPFTCPHGRPTLIRINKHEIDRKFGR